MNPIEISLCSIHFHFALSFATNPPPIFLGEPKVSSCAKTVTNRTSCSWGLGLPDWWSHFHKQAVYWGCNGNIIVEYCGYNRGVVQERPWTWLPALDKDWSTDKWSEIQVFMAMVQNGWYQMNTNFDVMFVLYMFFSHIISGILFFWAIP